MNQELFQQLLKNQTEYSKIYRENKQKEHVIKVIKNRKYKSKGNRDLNEIHKALSELGCIDEVILTSSSKGELVFESITAK